MGNPHLAIRVFLLAFIILISTVATTKVTAQPTNPPETGIECNGVTRGQGGQIIVNWQYMDSSLLDPDNDFVEIIVDNELLNTLDVSSNSHTFVGQHGIVYEFKIRLANSAGANSTICYHSAISADARVDPEPSVLNVSSSHTSTDISLDWDVENNEDVDHWIICWSKDQDFNKEDFNQLACAQSGSSSTTFTISREYVCSEVCTGTYFFAVAGVDMVGNRGSDGSQTSILFSNYDFSSALNLESGITQNGLLEGGEDEFFKINVTSQGDVIQFHFNDLDQKNIQFCIYDGNQSTDLVWCNIGSTTHSIKSNTNNAHFIKIHCGECATGENGRFARYAINATMYQDEAGDSAASAKLIDQQQEDGFVFSDENGNPFDSDFYSVGVNPGDDILVVISSYDIGTGFRIYDQDLELKWVGYREAPYNVEFEVEDGSIIYIEIFCLENNDEPCEYSLGVVGSTFTSGASSNDREQNRSSDLWCFGIGIFTVFVYAAFSRSHNKKKLMQYNYDFRQPTINSQMRINEYDRNRMQAEIARMNEARIKAQNEIERMEFEMRKLHLEKENAERNANLQQMISSFEKMKRIVEDSEQERAELQKKLDEANSTNVIQNITYNISDSAISGDINTGMSSDD